MAFAAGGAAAPFLEAIPVEDLVGGELLDVLKFRGEGRIRTGVSRGRGLDGRRSLDLRALTPETLVVPNDRFYVRTRAPARLDDQLPWRIRVRGLVGENASIDLDTLTSRARPQGVHLLECSGNGAPYGLMSSAAWSGVPLAEIIAAYTPAAKATRVLIRGFDTHEGRPDLREAGASWIFTPDQIASTGAFLATAMNGAGLPRDNGWPVRLVVPGWYGCTCIKWVDEIRFVTDQAPSTTHMREFAGRTHQRRVPGLARDYRAAAIDLCAMPIRVERWRVDGRIAHRVVGIIWGGSRTTDEIRIRFNPGERWVPVEQMLHETSRSWSLWTHRWTPPKPGRYRIRLRVPDTAIRTRRLDRGYYDREVDVT